LLAFRKGGSLEIVVGGETFALTAEEVEIREQARGDLVVESDLGFTVALDPRIDDELRMEGIARELVSRIQRARREAGLAVSDRIRLGVFSADSNVASAAKRWSEYIAGETLAVALEVGTDISKQPEYAVVLEAELDGLAVRIALEAVREG
jgi:isoleucyl-tRNA synthetase